MLSQHDSCQIRNTSRGRSELSAFIRAHTDIQPAVVLPVLGHVHFLPPKSQADGRSRHPLHYWSSCRNQQLIGWQRFQSSQDLHSRDIHNRWQGKQPRDWQRGPASTAMTFWIWWGPFVSKSLFLPTLHWPIDIVLLGNSIAWKQRYVCSVGCLS